MPGRYDEKAKERIMRYQKAKREMMNLNLPLGTKEHWKKRIEQTGDKSVTAYIMRLIEKDIEENP